MASVTAEAAAAAEAATAATEPAADPRPSAGPRTYAGGSGAARLALRHGAALQLVRVRPLLHEVARQRQQRRQREAQGEEHDVAAAATAANAGAAQSSSGSNSSIVYRRAGKRSVAMRSEAPAERGTAAEQHTRTAELW